MRILSLTIRLHAPWVPPLKEKRMGGFIHAKLRNKYNVSAAETDEQDIHQIIVIGVASIAANHAQADSMEEEILHFVESNTEAELVEHVKEVF